MKKILIFLIITFSAFISTAAQYEPEPSVIRLSSGPKTFRTFYLALRKALDDGKKVQVAASARFPFSYDFDATAVR